MKLNHFLLSAALSLSSTVNAATVSLDGDYNWIETETSMALGHWLDGSNNLHINPRSDSAGGYEWTFDQSDNSFHFNDGNGSSVVEYFYETYLEDFIHTSAGTNWTFHRLEAGTDNPSDLSITGSYVANNNLLQASGTDTEVGEDPEIIDEVVMSTTNGELVFLSWAESEKDQDTCFGCGDNGGDVLIGLSFHEYGGAVGLKKGTVNLALSAFTGTYSWSQGGNTTECFDAGGDVDGDPNNYKESCKKTFLEYQADGGYIDFNGGGGCTITRSNGGSGFVRDMNNPADNRLFARTSFIETSTACSYTVSGVDNLTVSSTLSGSVEIVKLKVSANHNFLRGHDLYSGGLPAVGDWTFTRGKASAAKLTTTPTLGDFSGTFLGAYGRGEGSNACLTDGDSNSTTCPATDRPTNKFSQGRYAVTFGGDGSCTWKEYVRSSELHLISNNPQGAYIVDDQGMKEATCSYVLDATPTLGVHRIDITTTFPGETPEHKFATLGVNGETFGHSAGKVLQVALNNGTVLPSNEFTFELGKLIGESGSAIKYDGVATDEVIAIWLKAGSVQDDFGGDGKADILVRRNDNGLLYLFEMDGNIRVGSKIGGLNSVWQVVAIDDFGGDGKADILTRRTDNGKLFLWEMNGNQRTGSLVGNLSLVWDVVGTGDLNGDGKADIVTRRNDNGLLYLWEMDGSNRTGSKIGGLNQVWEVIAVDDFGGDGKADILTRRTDTGKLFLWEMDGNQRTGSVVGNLTLVWDVVGTGDLNGDGKADIVTRRNDNGLLYLWEMDGSNRTGSKIGGLNQVWDVERIADYGGDGKADILTRRSDNGKLYLWHMNSRQRTGQVIGSQHPVWNVEVQ